MTRHRVAPGSPPAWLAPHVVDEGALDLGDESIPYYVVARSLAPNLPYFAGFPSVLFISEDVPVDARESVLIHEVTCLRDKTPGHCRRALDVELALVPPDRLRAYAAMRVEFLTALLASGQAGALAPEITETLAALRVVDVALAAQRT